MEGLIEVMLENGEAIPNSEAPELIPRFGRVAHTLQNDDESEPIFEQLSTKISEGV